jgi:hypothetical protein
MNLLHHPFSFRKVKRGGGAEGLRLPAPRPLPRLPSSQQSSKQHPNKPLTTLTLVAALPPSAILSLRQSLPANEYIIYVAALQILHRLLNK